MAMSGKAPQSFLVKQEREDYVVTFAELMTACADLWARLEKEFICSPYQRFSFCRSWYEAQAEPKPKPCTVLISDARGAPLMLIPLIVETGAGARIARFMGNPCTVFAVPLFKPGLALPPAILRNIFSRLAHDERIGAFHIDRIPQSWGGERNPLLVFPHKISNEAACWHRLQPSAKATLNTMRSESDLQQLRSKLRKLKEAGSLSILEAKYAGERIDALKIFLAQRHAHFRRTNMPDSFCENHMQAFLQNLAADEPAFRIFTLNFEDRICAVFLGLQQQKRLCGWASSEAEDIAAFAPGEILLQHIIVSACDEGLDVFDLGIFENENKSHWLHEREKLHTAIFGFGWRGAALAQILLLKYSLGASKKPSLFHCINN